MATLLQFPVQKTRKTQDNGGQDNTLLHWQPHEQLVLMSVLLARRVMMSHGRFYKDGSETLEHSKFDLAMVKEKTDEDLETIYFYYNYESTDPTVVFSVEKTIENGQVSYSDWFYDKTKRHIGPKSVLNKLVPLITQNNGVSLEQIQESGCGSNHYSTALTNLIYNHHRPLAEAIVNTWCSDCHRLSTSANSVMKDGKIGSHPLINRDWLANLNEHYHSTAYDENIWNDLEMGDKLKYYLKTGSTMDG